uniref:VTT domain-containing protein n=1 Tax=Brassica oleracea TaxID=3712 RepID=Q2A965_BRAOL|nr:hypothetical protein 40.t00088 [Brassica oleracea]
MESQNFTELNRNKLGSLIGYDFDLIWKDGLLNYMLFLRLTPTLPNTFINVASPIVDVPYHIFFLATFIGLIPAAFVTVRAGIALGELQSLGDLYDFSSMATLFLIGVLSVTPTLISKKKA